ncbi:MAG: hypothetical protein COS25_02895 [Candidatus Nealsonbacteria bacterium CG02_land_8_20_14_3_00_37_10]|uniref:Uncharacterized protein n=1 Tax=Candidatus Nealsonbacteria bacterium CG02_land_8_20_14_3_00_37_10 TaxID=1974699 RepID=A0A2M7D8U3_9BACT|nr:MAG: hypothetical protein COS25_02895 [Candidatus Nealsonbacteria bacterium CG02_land_8_20_14_3_00_37_10]
MKYIKKILSTLILFCFLAPLFGLINPSILKSSGLKGSPRVVFAQSENQINPPENIEEVKAVGEKALGVGEKELPGIIEKIWKEEVLPIWQKMWDWVKANIWSRIESWIKPEIEKRKQFFEEGFGREKEEMKEELKTEVPKVSKSLWEKFRELIK